MEFLYGYIRDDICSQFLKDGYSLLVNDDELDGPRSGELTSPEIRLLKPFKEYKQHDFELWTGFRLAIRPIGGVPMLNVDVDHLVVKFESGLSLLNEIKKDMPVASKQEQNLEFQRRVVGAIIV
jgi:hypothetical protein